VKQDDNHRGEQAFSLHILHKEVLLGSHELQNLCQNFGYGFFAEEGIVRALNGAFHEHFVHRVTKRIRRLFQIRAQELSDAATAAAVAPA